jgi:molybdate transport system permease protein
MLEGRALDAFRISIEVAATATLLVALPGFWLGWFLARRQFLGKTLVETLVALPLVLPPTAVGYLILYLVSRNGPLGQRALGFDPDLLLSWKGAVLASAVMSLPIVARTARVAFEAVPSRVELMGRSLGYSRAKVLRSLTLPLARRGLQSALVLGFARALGEFGATVVVAGNVRGRTQTLALAIFEDIQLGRHDSAMHLVAISSALAFALILASERLQRKAR